MENFDNSKFFIFNPVKNGENLYYSKVMYDNDELILQLKKTEVEMEYSKNNCKIIPDENTINLVNKIDEHIIENTTKNSLSWFGKEISKEDCKKLFKSCLENNILNCYVDEDCQCYKNKETVDIETLSGSVVGIPLIKCNAIIYTKGNFFIRWELVEFKIKKETKENILLNDYCITDLDEDKRPLDFYEDEKITKKINKLTLF